MNEGGKLLESERIDECSVGIEEDQRAVGFFFQDSAGNRCGRRNHIRGSAVRISESVKDGSCRRNNRRSIRLVRNNDQAKMKHGLPVIEGTFRPTQAGKGQVDIRIRCDHELTIPQSF